MGTETEQSSSSSEAVSSGSEEAKCEPTIETELKDSAQPTICAICNMQNLIKPVLLRTCSSPDCNRIYCVHFSSPIDPMLCLYCLSDVTCIEEIGRSIHSYVDEDSGITHSHTRRYRSIKFTGLDWLFQNRKIATLSDTELGVAIEYHRAILGGMIHEREERRVKHFHRNAGKGTPIVPGQLPDLLNISTGIKSSSTTTKVRKTKTTTVKSPAEIAAQASEIIAALQAKGLSLDMIMAAMRKK